MDLCREMRKKRAYKQNGSRYSLRVEPIIHAKVPILKITDPCYKIEMDISCFRSESGIYEVGELLAKYCEYDPRVRPFLVAIKGWSKRRGLNDARNYFINSFGWVMLCIKYLQCLSPPVLPVYVATGKINYNDFVVKTVHGASKSSNKMNIGQLLCGFFEFWARFDYSNDMISVRQPGIQDKNFMQFKAKSSHQTLMLIEDPLEPSHNVAKNVRKDTLEAMIEDFRRGAVLCRNSGWQDLCKEVKRQSQYQGGQWNRKKGGNKKKGQKRKRNW